MSSFPFPIERLDTPAILIDSELLGRNIREMQLLADRHGIGLRPHVKSHKSIALANRQIAAGAIGIAVAKLGEAEIMAEVGISDIQVANQVVGRIKIERMISLAKKITISCAVDSLDNLKELGELFGAHGLVANVLIEIDTGLHRSGLSRWEEILELAQAASASPHISLFGLMTHAGHAYAAQDQATRQRIGIDEGNQLVAFAERLRHESIAAPVISAGSTPTAQFVAATPGLTELRVGNYLLNDAIQVALGVAEWERCALSVLTTVISVHPDRLVIDAGSKVFSSDAGAHGSSLLSGYGQVVGLSATVTRLSEEHGVIVGEFAHLTKVGDRLRVIPNHACPVMNLAESAWLVESGSVIDKLEIDARAKTA